MVQRHPAHSFQASIEPHLIFQKSPKAGQLENHNGPSPRSDDALIYQALLVRAYVIAAFTHTFCNFMHNLPF